MNVTYQSNFDALPAVFEAYAQAAQKELPEILVDQANKLASSDFGDGRTGLFQRAAKLAPRKELLRALPLVLGWRIKREKGRPVFTVYEHRKRKRGKKAGTIGKFRKGQSGEINRRIAARFSHAFGWVNPSLLKYHGGFRKKMGGFVRISTDGDQLIVEITNMRTNSREVNLAHGDYVAAALADRIEDMLEYIDRHMDRVTVDFENAKLPPASPGEAPRAGPSPS